MLLQTNAYFVPPEKRTEHARLLQRFRHALARLGCDQFECYEQTGTNWTSGESKNRFIQIMRFRDRKHQQQVQAAERNDPQAQNLIKEFCELINFPYQQQQGYFAVGFYNSVLPVAALRVASAEETPALPATSAMGEAPEPLSTDTLTNEATPVESAPEPESVPESEEHSIEGESEVATADFGDVVELTPESEESAPPERH